MKMKESKTTMISIKYTQQDISFASRTIHPARILHLLPQMAGCGLWAKDRRVFSHEGGGAHTDRL